MAKGVGEKKGNVLLFPSPDHRSNTMTMGASRPTGCTASSYQSARPTLASRRQIMDRFLGPSFSFRCYQSVVHLQRSPSLSLHPQPSTPCPFYPPSVHRLPALSVSAVLFSTAICGAAKREKGSFYPSKPPTALCHEPL